VLEESAFTDEELAGYEYFWDGISVEKTLYNSARREGLAEGRAEGIVKGKAEGIAEGRAEGLAEGEAKGKRLIAANMKKSGIDPLIIVQCTGLSIEEIERL
jgi:predicted transposase/invertase (TIGR01784 family)